MGSGVDFDSHLRGIFGYSSTVVGQAVSVGRLQLGLFSAMPQPANPSVDATT
jgi:hypothetical protein